MDEDILSAIVDVEKEVRELQEAERRRAEERLAEARREAEARVAGEEERLREALREALGRARSEAEREAAALLEKEEARAERLGRLDDATLEGIVARHLQLLRPGRDDDRQNGEG
ncbi:MAG: hypothetical protein NDI77_08165 [Geobacteraceae bacterium]|nr:hypothetical protein [Geobacteraceae bacterium]